jgi:hypothetical protein
MAAACRARRQMRFETRLGDEDLFIDENVDGAIAVLSPDGGTIVYLATIGPVRRLYSRPLDRLESQAIPGTEGAQNQFLSPNGQALAFFANGNLMRMPLAGGRPHPSPRLRTRAAAPGDRTTPSSLRPTRLPGCRACRPRAARPQS